MGRSFDAEEKQDNLAQRLHARMAKEASEKLLARLQKFHPEQGWGAQPNKPEQPVLSGVAAPVAKPLSTKRYNSREEAIRQKVVAARTIRASGGRIAMSGWRYALLVDDLATPTKFYQKVVCNYYDVALSGVMSESRSAYLVWPRQMTMAIARHLTSLSMPTLGRRFGRDHTTVLHAIRRVEKLRREDADVERQYQELVEQIQKYWRALSGGQTVAADGGTGRGVQADGETDGVADACAGCTHRAVAHRVRVALEADSSPQVLRNRISKALNTVH